jgi:hypothetical protein
VATAALLLLFWRVSPALGKLFAFTSSRFSENDRQYYVNFIERQLRFSHLKIGVAVFGGIISHATLSPNLSCSKSLLRLLDGNSTIIDGG